jgi:hypothetical protein
VSNKGQRERRIIDTALKEHEEDLRRMDEELASFFADDEDNCLFTGSVTDASLFKDWPFNDESCKQPIDNSDSCLEQIDWGERSLQTFAEDIVSRHLDGEI